MALTYSTPEVHPLVSYLLKLTESKISVRANRFFIGCVALQKQASTVNSWTMELVPVIVPLQIVSSGISSISWPDKLWSLCSSPLSYWVPIRSAGYISTQDTQVVWMAFFHHHHQNGKDVLYFWLSVEILSCTYKQYENVFNIVENCRGRAEGALRNIHGNCFWFTPNKYGLEREPAFQIIKISTERSKTCWNDLAETIVLSAIICVLRAIFCAQERLDSKGWTPIQAEHNLSFMQSNNNTGYLYILSNPCQIIHKIRGKMKYLLGFKDGKSMQNLFTLRLLHNSPGEKLFLHSLLPVSPGL